MTLNEATHLLRTRQCDMHTHAAAGAYLQSYYDANRHLLRSFPADGAALTVDAKLDAVIANLERLAQRRNRTMTRDQPALPKATAAEIIPYERGGQLEAGLHGAQEASERPAGARRIMQLPYAASAYVITTTANGEVWLCFTGKTDNALNPGVVTGDRIRAERTRDEAWSRNSLKAINQANRRAWNLADA
jgi:hypothetical protein